MRLYIKTWWELDSFHILLFFVLKSSLTMMLNNGLDIDNRQSLHGIVVIMYPKPSIRNYCSLFIISVSLVNCLKNLILDQTSEIIQQLFQLSYGPWFPWKLMAIKWLSMWKFVVRLGPSPRPWLPKVEL